MNNSKISIQTVTSKGRALFSKENISEGSLIFEDTSILCSTPVRTRSLRLESMVARKKKDNRLINRAVELNTDGLIIRSDIKDSQEAYERVRHLYPEESSSPSQTSSTLTVCRASDVFFYNGAEMISCGGPSPLVGVFETLSMINHSCNPNAFYISSWDSIKKTPKASIYALKDITKGEEITFSYVSSSQSRSGRRAEIKASWGFQCTCPRCESNNGDDTQLLLCNRCNDGSIPVGSDSRGCTSCFLSFPLSNGSIKDGLVAGNIRSDLLFWLDNHDFIHERILHALNGLHPKDTEFRILLEVIVNQSIDRFCASNGEAEEEKERRGVFSGELLVRMASTVRAGEETCLYLPLPQRKVLGRLLEGDAACTAYLMLTTASQGLTADEDKRSNLLSKAHELRKLASHAYRSASHVFSSGLLLPFYPKSQELASLLAKAAKIDNEIDDGEFPMTRLALQQLRLVRSRLLDVQSGAIDAAIDEITYKRLWGSKKVEI